MSSLFEEAWNTVNHLCHSFAIETLWGEAFLPMIKCSISHNVAKPFNYVFILFPGYSSFSSSTFIFDMSEKSLCSKELRQFITGQYVFFCLTILAQN